MAGDTDDEDGMRSGYATPVSYPGIASGSSPMRAGPGSAAAVRGGPSRRSSVDYNNPTQDRIQRQPSEDSNKDKGKDRDRDRERDIEKGREDLVARIKEVERARLREIAKRRLQDKKARMAELAAQVWPTDRSSDGQNKCVELC
jgi:hypothetical protein